MRRIDSFRVTKDQRIFLGEKEIKYCTDFKIIAKSGDSPEVELRVIVESVNLDNYQAIPKRGE